MTLIMLGAGAWGTALAIHAARRHDVLLWARDPLQAARMQAVQVNDRYLPGVGFPGRLQVTADFLEALRPVASGALVVVATPMSALRATLQSLPAGVPALWLCKGFEADTGALGHELAAALRPGVPCGVLSGPSFALEVARGQPTALVAASDTPALVQQAVEVFHGDGLRVYRSADPVGVEVGGAVKNVLAIATGILDGLGHAHSADGTLPGLNARAALITRGLAEMTRLGVALGAQPGTFMGLSGLGDLVLTATGDLSRNRQVGLGLAAGKRLSQVLGELGHVAEGVYSAKTVVARARQQGVEMPIAESVLAVLEGQLSPARAVGLLMARAAKAE
ncbi:MAG: NAD(P)H-dependent glycerol-3-phosphate dehydrogenase [Rubrivivax sp.]